MYEFPDWFWRSCEDCQRYVFTKSRIRRGGDGEPVPNPFPPKCENTPCKSRKAKPRLSDDDRDLYELWIIAKHTGQLPEPGGILNQEPIFMDRFRVLFQFDDALKEVRHAASSAALMAGLFSGKR